MRTTVQLVCEECQAIFDKKPTDIRRTKHHFCSRQCAAKFHNQRRRKPKYCLKCEALLERKGQKMFCSHQCQHDYHREQRATKGEIGSASAKRYLIETRGHRCESCRRCTWLGQPITLELDHIDGHWQNNDLHNLRLLCPNCHSMTSTWKNRNKGNGRKFRRDRYLRVT